MSSVPWTAFRQGRLGVVTSSRRHAGSRQGGGPQMAICVLHLYLPAQYDDGHNAASDALMHC